MVVRIIVALWLLVLAAPVSAQLTARFGPRGEISSLEIGGRVVFARLLFSVVKPGWDGDIVRQDAGTETARVTRQGERTTWRFALQGEGVAFACAVTATRQPGRIALTYALTPDRSVAVETVALRGLMPAPEHAGRTLYTVSDDQVSRGTWPAQPPAASHLVLGGRGADWLAYTLDDGSAVRLAPTGLSTQLQDNRFWQFAEFETLWTGPSGTLKAGQTVTFGLQAVATTKAGVDAEVKAMQGGGVGDARMRRSGALGVAGVRAARAGVPVYGMAEVTADVSGTYDNPFDARQISVDAEVKLPDGKRVTVPAFYASPMRLETRLGTERVRANGQGGFRVRFAPTQVGKHTLTVRASAGGKTVRSRPVTITATRSADPGFVRVGSRRYFRTDDGKPYICVGENVCWSHPRTPIAEYREWLSKLGAAGGNWARLWLANNEKGLEWTAAPSARPGIGAYAGLGRYAMDNAWRLDRILDIGRSSGVRLMFCLGTYGEFTEGGYFGEGMWVGNPYNAANGGPCKTPADFWTNAEARRLYKQRLRYIVARWGWSPHVFAWEFWNEVPPSKEQAAWVAEMAAYLKRIDPNRHLVSTTYGNDDVWKCPDIDFTMTHMYGQAGNVADFTARIQSETRAALAHPKPYLLAEFGIDWQTGDNRWDPKGTGVNMHNGAWAGILSGGAGTAMLWYWDGYVHPNNLYRILTPVAKFVQDIAWNAEDFAPVNDVGVRSLTNEPEQFTGITVPADVEWGRTPGARYAVKPDGTVVGGPVPMTLGSPTRANPQELHSSITWQLDLPSAQRVTLRLGQVCTAARLVVALDGKTLVDRELAAGPAGAGPWKAAKLLEQYGCWVSDYDEDITVEVPAGKHDLSLTNAAGDWVQIRSITIPGVRSTRFPEVNALALAGKRTVLAWLHNRQSTWKTDYDGKTPAPIEGLQVTLPANHPGAWRVEWFDTWTGKALRTDRVEASGGLLTLSAPTFARDVAVRCAPAR